MAKAFIAKIQAVEPIMIKGKVADNIHLATVMSENVVVHKNRGVGFLGVFFPPDSQLSEEYCHNNNLFRNKEKNLDTERSGFFEENRRVRCQPFCGAKSEGFFAELGSLSWATPDIDTSVKQGESFDVLNGHEICKKYYNERTLKALKNKQNNGQKKEKQISTPLFTTHVDTDNFNYYVGNIKKGMVLSFHAKVHGCFTSEQKILMADGTKKKIKDVNIGDMVVGEMDGTSVPTKVLNTFINGEGEDWLDIIYDRRKYKGNSTGKIRCTPNHEFLLESGQYVEAKDLSKDSKVVLNKKDIIPSKQQIGVFLGMLVGDGYLSVSNNLQFCHKLDHEEYLNYKINLFKDIKDRTDKNTYKVSGYGSKTVFNLLPSNNTFTSLFSKNQKKGVGKILTEDLIDLATLETLAFWYYDDGSLQTHPSQKDRASIAICGIRDEDVWIVEKIFNKFEIFPVHFKDKNGYNRLRFNTKEAYKLFNRIKAYCSPCMKYKLPEELRESSQQRDIERSSLGVLRDIVSLEKDPIVCKKPPSSVLKYDIETATHNYVANEIVVHNSSFRCAHTKVVEKPKRHFITNTQLCGGKRKGALISPKLHNFREPVHSVLGVPKEERWAYIAGSRRVTLFEDKDKQKEGFHGSEAYRFEVLDQFKGHLEKGMTVYGEIAGYVNGKPIMSSHSTKVLKNKEFTKKYGDDVTYKYGCKETEYRFHVYRISYTSDEGTEIDFTDQQIMKWCDEHGFIPPLEVHPPVIYDGDQEKLKELVHNLTEREEVLCEDYIDPTHVSEGIIVRCDRAHLKPKFFKSKSYPFKVMEGIVKEKEIDLEDAS